MELHKSHLSQIMAGAHYYKSKGIYRTFSECLQASWQAYGINKSLREGEVSFSYRRSTGEIREARGTLKSSLFKFTNKGVKKIPQPDVITYWDLDVDRWRRCRIERLLTAA